MSDQRSYTLQKPFSNDDIDPIPSSQARHKSVIEVTVPSHTFVANYTSSSSSPSSTTTASVSSVSNINYPPPPHFPVYPVYSETNFYNGSSTSSGLPLLTPPQPPLPLNIPNWNYTEDTRSNIRSQHHQKKRRSPIAESSNPYPKHQVQSTTATKERRHRKQPHELLTESQKKANHIASEQKRRQNIRIGFDQLIDIVPSLNHGNRSEALILQKSVDHIRHLISLKNELKSQVRDLQGTLGDTNYEEDSSEDELLYTY